MDTTNNSSFALNGKLFRGGGGSALPEDYIDTLYFNGDLTDPDSIKVFQKATDYCYANTPFKMIGSKKDGMPTWFLANAWMDLEATHYDFLFIDPCSSANQNGELNKSNNINYRELNWQMIRFDPKALKLTMLYSDQANALIQTSDLDKLASVEYVDKAIAGAGVSTPYYILDLTSDTISEETKTALDAIHTARKANQAVDVYVRYTDTCVTLANTFIPAGKASQLYLIVLYISIDSYDQSDIYFHGTQWTYDTTDKSIKRTDGSFDTYNNAIKLINDAKTSLEKTITTTSTADKAYTDSAIESAIESLKTDTITPLSTSIEDVTSDVESLASTVGTLTTADTANVKLTGDQEIAGTKTFTSPVTIPEPVADTDASTKKYVDTAKAELLDAIGKVQTLKKQIVTDKAQITEDNILYLILNDSGSGDDIYDQYLCINGKPEAIGNTRMDLTSVVQLDNAQSITGVKTFTVSPKVPAPTANDDAVNKTYADAIRTDLTPIILTLTTESNLEAEPVISINDADGIIQKAVGYLKENKPIRLFLKSVDEQVELTSWVFTSNWEQVTFLGVSGLTDELGITQFAKQLTWKAATPTTVEYSSLGQNLQMLMDNFNTLSESVSTLQTDYTELQNNYTTLQNNYTELETRLNAILSELIIEAPDKQTAITQSASDPNHMYVWYESSTSGSEAVSKY